MLPAGIRPTTGNRLRSCRMVRIIPIDLYATCLDTEDGSASSPCAVTLPERKQAQEALERERQSLWRMLQASDHERQTISYEIHDGLAQYLAAAIMQFQAHDALERELTRQSQESLRDGPGACSPGPLRVTAANQRSSPARHRRRLGLRRRFHIWFTNNGDVEARRSNAIASVQFGRLPPILENALYRIVQEALTNACKHSKSKKVTVTMTQEGQDVRLEVRDWGIGFDPESVGKGHFGLEGIRQRVRLLGGRLTIESTPGSGTLVQVVVPILERQNEG